jgi:hypothetical protein
MRESVNLNDGKPSARLPGELPFDAEPISAWTLEELDDLDGLKTWTIEQPGSNDDFQ